MPPNKEAAGYGQAPCKGRPPALAAARKGLSPAALPQGPTTHAATVMGSRPWPGRRWRLP
ncbi:hypothetical protein B296_00047718, partial [Ensete ventricosum]